MELLITAFLTGFVGSFHCMGMCGPIALALPNVGNTLTGKISGRLAYNIGRIVTYALLGVLLGTFGLGLKLAGLQQSISIVAGVLIIIMVVFTSGVIERKIGSPFKLLKGETIAKLFKMKSHGGLFLIGALNGLLPCGFVYIALIGSVATQSSLQGAMFMVCFGLGTLPMMFGVSMAGQFISIQIRTRITKVVPYLAVLIGCVFILRGMNLGIPYVSPQISNDQQTVKDCCKPGDSTHQFHSK